MKRGTIYAERRCRMTDTNTLFACPVCDNPLPHVPTQDQNYVSKGRPVCSFICLVLDDQAEYDEQPLFV